MDASSALGRPKIVLVAMIAALLMAALAAVNGAMTNPVIGLFQTLVFAAAALGLKRNNAWAGYGLALFLVSTTAAALLASSPVGASLTIGVCISMIVTLGFAALAFFAGRSISTRNARPQRPSIPWILVAVVPSALLVLFIPMLLPTGSMEPTLLTGDSVLIRRAGASSFARGDLIVYRTGHEIFVKRVVGVGGDRIHLENKTLFVNGQAQNEPYAQHVAGSEDFYRDNFPKGEPAAADTAIKEALAREVRNGEFVDPPGTLFVLGDNRDSSLDSRYLGVVKKEDVIGKPVLVVFSRAGWSRFLKPL